MCGCIFQYAMLDHFLTVYIQYLLYKWEYRVYFQTTTHFVCVPTKNGVGNCIFVDKLPLSSAALGALQVVEPLTVFSYCT